MSDFSRKIRQLVRGDIFWLQCQPKIQFQRRRDCAGRCWNCCVFALQIFYSGPTVRPSMPFTSAEGNLAALCDVYLAPGTKRIVNGVTYQWIGEMNGLSIGSLPKKEAELLPPRCRISRADLSVARLNSFCQTCELLCLPAMFTKSVRVKAITRQLGERRQGPPQLRFFYRKYHSLA